MDNHLPPKPPSSPLDPSLFQYMEWIRNYSGETWRKCSEVTLEMNEEFPELIRTRGHVEIAESPNPQQHWWLETTDGKVVDPTAGQWSMILCYHPWEEGAEEPTGKCPNCGEYSYRGRLLCSSRCDKEYAAYINSCL